MTFDKKLKLSLLSLRYGVFVVMFMWTIDKFINPDHAAKVFEKYYMFEGLTLNASYAIGVLQLVILFAFLTGIKKRLSYGLIFIMHLVSTLSAYNQYLDPWTVPNLLFYAAFPMLAAIFTLYLLRERDTLLTL